MAEAWEILLAEESKIRFLALLRERGWRPDGDATPIEPITNDLLTKLTPWDRESYDDIACLHATAIQQLLSKTDAADAIAVAQDELLDSIEDWCSLARPSICEAIGRGLIAVNSKLIARWSCGSRRLVGTVLLLSRNDPTFVSALSGWQPCRFGWRDITATVAQALQWKLDAVWVLLGRALYGYRPGSEDRIDWCNFCLGCPAFAQAPSRNPSEMDRLMPPPVRQEILNELLKCGSGAS